MTIDQVIAAQEANEANALNGRIDFKTFDAIRAKLAIEESKAMAAISARIAHRTIS